jgi:hypothetical protein
MSTVFVFRDIFSFAAEAMAHLRAHLSPNAILVGQSIQKDVQWLQLAEGVDYASLIDLSALFRVWNQSRGEYTSFSQDHCAKVWIGVGDRANHDAVTDAAISMSLFNAYRTVQWDPMRLLQLQQATLTAPRVPGFSARNPVIDGCWYVLLDDLHLDFISRFVFVVFIRIIVFLFLILFLFKSLTTSMGNRKQCTCGAPFL